MRSSGFSTTRWTSNGICSSEGWGSDCRARARARARAPERRLARFGTAPESRTAGRLVALWGRGILAQGNALGRRQRHGNAPTRGTVSGTAIRQRVVASVGHHGGLVTSAVGHRGGWSPRQAGPCEWWWVRTGRDSSGKGWGKGWGKGRSRVHSRPRDAPALGTQSGRSAWHWRMATPLAWLSPARHRRARSSMTTGSGARHGKCGRRYLC